MTQRSTLVSALLLALAACGDNGSSARPDAGAPVDAAPDTDGGTTEVQPGLAVVNSDYISSSITLLDPATGAVTNADCINSGSKPPGTTVALSRDVSLPSSPQLDHAIVAIDRNQSVLTWLKPRDCAPIHQLDVSTGFGANPYDVVQVSATKAYVTRYEKNPTPTAAPGDFDEGDDVLIIDPSVPKITGRISLSSSAASAGSATIQARPTRAQLIDGKLYVVLNDINAGFDTMAHGRVAVIDAATDKVTGTIEIPNLFNCGALAYVAASKTLVVTCAGDYNTVNAALTSGLSYIDLGASPPVQVKEQLAAAFGGRALGAYSGIANDGALGFAVTAGVGGNGTPKDQLWRFDVATGKAVKIADASDSYVYGSVLIDPARKQMFLTDADAAKPVVHLYDYSGATATEKSATTSDATHGLPPREIAWY